MGNVSEKENKKIEEKEMILVDETIIRDKIYVVRGQKVMLDMDLAEVQNQIAEVVENLNEMVSYSELAEYMSEFGDPHIKSGYLIYI